MFLDELWLLAFTALLFIPLERLLPLHASQTTARAGIGTDLLHLLLSGAIIRAGVAIGVVGIGLLVASVVPDAVSVSVRSQPAWLEFIELFLLSDLCFYIGHRIVHAVPWLWRFHAVHHSSEQLDWLASFRVHPVDQLFNALLIAVPGIALGFSVEVLLAYALLYRWHALLLHSNVRVELGWLDAVIATPRFHHWHHADQVEAYDLNFGGQTVIWDRLFGTANRAETLPLRYGVSDPLPADYPGQLVAPFRRDTAAQVSPIPSHEPPASHPRASCV